MGKIVDRKSFLSQAVNDIAPDLATLPNWLWSVVEPLAKEFIWQTLTSVIATAMRQPNRAVQNGLGRFQTRPITQSAPVVGISQQNQNVNVMEPVVTFRDYKRVGFERIEADTVLVNLRELAEKEPNKELSVAVFFSQSGISKFDTNCYNWYWTSDELRKADMRCNQDGSYYINIAPPHLKRKYA